eukprot:EG_transcript_921
MTVLICTEESAEMQATVFSNTVALVELPDPLLLHREVLVTVRTSKGISCPVKVDLAGHEPPTAMDDLALAGAVAVSQEATSKDVEMCHDYFSLYESQRYAVFKGWSGGHLKSYFADPYPWTDSKGFESEPRDEIHHPPLGCQWDGEWELDISGATDPEGWQYASVSFGLSSAWAASVSAASCLRRRLWRRRIHRIQDVAKEYNVLHRQVIDASIKSRKTIAQIDAAVQAGDPQKAGKLIKQLQEVIQPFGDEKYGAFAEVADLLSICAVYTLRTEPGGDIALLQDKADAAQLVALCQRPMKYARQYSTKREGLLAKKYIDELTKLAQPLFTEARFQGLPTVTQFRAEYEQLLREDVVVAERRAEALQRDYEAAVTAVQQALGTKTLAQAQKSWQQVQQVVKRIHEGGPEFDLLHHDSVKELIAAHEATAAQVQLDLQALQALAEAQNVLSDCRRAMTQVQNSVNRRDGAAAEKHWKQLSSKVRPLLEAEGSRTLEGMQQFAAEYDALEGSVRQLAMDCRAEAIRTQYDALRKAMEVQLEKQQVSKAQQSWEQLETLVARVSAPDGAEHALAAHPQLQSLLGGHPALAAATIRTIAALLHQSDVDTRTQQLRPRLLAVQAAVRARDGAKAVRLWGEMAQQAADLEAAGREAAVTAAVADLLHQCRAVEHQLQLNRQADGQVQRQLLTEAEVFQRQREAVAREEVACREALALSELEEWRAARRQLLRQLHPEPYWVFRALDKCPVLFGDEGQPDVELTRAVALALLASGAAYAPAPSRWLEEQGAGLAPWVVRRHTLGEGCHLFEGPDDWGVVACRGTANQQDVCTDLRITQASRYGCNIHAGFLERADAVSLDEMKAFLRRGHRLLVCGHSLGGAIASLVTLRLLDSQGPSAVEPDCVWRVRCVTFGMPLVGCERLAAYVRNHRYQFHHCVCNGDVVPRLLVAKNKAQASFTETMMSDSIPRLTQAAVAVGAPTASPYVATVVGLATGFALPLMMQPWLDRQFRPYHPFGTYLFINVEEGWECDEVLRTRQPRTILTLLGDGRRELQDHRLDSYGSAFERLKRQRAPALLLRGPSGVAPGPAGSGGGAAPMDPEF